MQGYAKKSLTENALRVLERRYLAKDSGGNIVETPEQLFQRVANAVALPDKNYGVSDEQVRQTAEEFYQMIANLEYIPNSPTLMNAGRPLGQLSACFVLPVGDSMEDIFETIKHAALIHKSGGGTGFSFSRLRPRNSMVNSTSGVASGPVSFMKVFNAATEAVKQGGTRRGANMGILRVDHPDIEEFISCKDDLLQITNFNISVAITDEFMRAVKENRNYALRDPRSGTEFRINGDVATKHAPTIFNQIIAHAWQTGEPGIVFIDRMNQLSPSPGFEEIEATNPCGEQPLPPYDSCNLGSINLGETAFEELPHTYDPRNEPEKGVDWEKLARLVKTTVHFLDNIIDANKYPIPEIEQQTHRNRRIGLGVMGWADMLIKLRVPYNSEQAFRLGEKVMEFVNTEGHIQSSELARTRGKFPNWEKSRFAKDGVIMRNATVTTIAPTGTISIIAGCSSGIEPYYAISYVRTVMDNTKMIEVNPLFEKIARQRGFYSQELMERIANDNSIQGFDEIPSDVKEIFITAADVSPKEHIRMQAEFQKHCDSSVSKTINMDASATQQDVFDAYWYAYEHGCKGVTIYRDGSRPMQVLSTGKTADPTAKKAEAPATPSHSHTEVHRETKTHEAPVHTAPTPSSMPLIEDRPDVLHGITERIRTGYGNLYITINTSADGKPFEVFAQIGKSGWSTMADTEAICRMISLALRSNVPVDAIIEQLTGIGGESPLFQNGELVKSIPDAISMVLKKHFGNGKEYRRESTYADVCPDCGSQLQHDSGCVTCRGCGYNKC
jgi:ribonucleoside-diphosphate reductase alpha chain